MTRPKQEGSWFLPLVIASAFVTWIYTVAPVMVWLWLGAAVLVILGSAAGGGGGGDRNCGPGGPDPY